MAYKDGHIFDEEDKAILKKLVNYSELTSEDIEAFAENTGSTQAK